MKRNTLFLLSYSIIIPLVSTKAVDPPVDDLTALSVEQYQSRCEKFFKNNFTKVEDYVKECKDTGPIRFITDLMPHICFGVVNNIIIACDKSAVNILQFVNDTYKNESSYVNENLCPLETLEVEDFLKSNKKFNDVMGYLKNEGYCSSFCYEIHTKVTLDHCLLWHKTSELLKNFKSQPVQEEKNVKHTGDSTSQNKTVTVLENTDSKSKSGSNDPAHLKDNSRAATQPQPNVPDPKVDATIKKPEEKVNPPTIPKEKPNPPPKTESHSGKAENVNVAPKNPKQLEDDNPQPVSQDETPGDAAPKPKEIPNFSADDGFSMDNNLGDKTNFQTGYEEKASSTSNNAVDIPPAFLDENGPQGGEDEEGENPLQAEGPPEKKKIADPETAPSKSVVPNDVAYSDGISEEESHFYVYFFTSASIVIFGYVAFHNKNKILAYALEGRRSRNGRRRPNSASYRKLECSLEEAITSNSSHASVTNVVY